MEAMPTRADVLRSLAGQLSLTGAGEDSQARLRDGVAVLLDDRLEETATRDLGRSDTRRLLAADGLARLAVATETGLLLVGAESVHVDGDGFDSAAFLGDLLVATRPEGAEHEVLLVDPVTGAVLDRVAIDAEDAAAFITRHPHEPIVVIELAMGQDGCLALRVHVENRALVVSEILPGQDPVVAGFSPAGDRLLVVPHPSDMEAVRVLSWPDLEEVGALSAEDLPTEMGFGLAACWIDDDRIACYATEDALVVTDGALRGPERVTMPVDFVEEGDLESLVRLRPGRVAAGIWMPGGRSTLVLDVTSA